MSATRVILGGGSASSYDVRQGTVLDARGEPHKVLVLTVRDDGRDRLELLAQRLAAALKAISHPNVEKPLQEKSPTGLHGDRLIIPLPDGGDLRAYLAANPAADVLVIARKIARAVQYLHARTPRVIHSNLDLSSVLMHGDTPRLWDFSLCRLDPAPDAGPLADLAPQAAGEREGVLAAIAPELYAAGPVTTASDVYAFGILLFELFARHGPFPSSGRLHAAALLYAGQRPARDEIAHGPRGDAVWAIVTRCWVQDPAQRPDMAQVEQPCASSHDVDELSRTRFG